MLPRESGKPDTPAMPAEPTPAASAQGAPAATILPLPHGPAAAWRGEPALPPPALTAAPDASALLKALRRRWVVALALTLLAGGGALGAAAVLVPAKYAVFASVQVAQAIDDGILRHEVRLEFPTLIKTQAARLKARDVLLKALNDDRVKDLSITRRFPDTFSTIVWLEDELKVDFQDGSEFITLTMNSEQPEEAVVLVDAVVKSYLNLVTGKESDLRRQRVDKVAKLVKGAQERLQDKITELNGMCKDQGLPDSAAVIQKHQGLQRQYEEAERSYSLAQFELAKARGKLAAHNATRKPLDISIVPDIFLKRETQNDPVLKQKLDLMAALQRAVLKMESEGHPPNESTLVQTKRRLAAMRREVDEQSEQVRKEIFENYRAKMEGDHKAIAEVLQEEIKPLQDQVKHLSERVDTLKRETDTIGYSTAKIELLKVAIKQEETALQTLKTQMQEVQLNELSDYRVSPGQEAGWQNSIAKKRLILLLLAPLAAMGAVAFGIAFLEFKARRIHSTDEVVAGLGMRVVGAVPAVSAPRKQRHRAVLAGDDLGSHLIESIDGIRTMLLRSAGSDGTRIVMVTSAVAGEGKTTLASNLALSLARAGRRTLLLDCDLRRPAAHQVFEQTLQPGFSEVLLGEVELPDAVRPTTSDENLWLLPAGQWDREVLQELAREQPEGLFERLRQEFDFVVVDSHPVLPTADSLLIGQHVDAVIVSVMRQVSQAPRVYEACQRLSTLGIRIFGAVVNGMPSEAYGGEPQEKGQQAARERAG